MYCNKHCLTFAITNQLAIGHKPMKMRRELFFLAKLHSLL